MAEIKIATTTGRQLVLNADVIEQFRSRLRGAHLLQGEEVTTRHARSTTR